MQQSPQYDIVMDTVDTAPWDRARHALVPNGRMLLIAGSTSDMILGGLKARLRGKRLIGGVASDSVDILRKVVDLATAGDFRPVIDRSFGFSQMIAAHTHVDTGHKKGNVVVTVNQISKLPRTADEELPLGAAAHVG
jgi:NADPH:quinone reductase-like Zn-dependent oxidoreductase